MRFPEDPWAAHHLMQTEGREIARVIRSQDDGIGGDVDAGSVTVFFADGSHTYVHRGDLFCVEFEI
jgi:hypothetical protein